MVRWPQGWPIPAQAAGGWAAVPRAIGIARRPAPARHEHFSSVRRVPFRSEVGQTAVNGDGQAQITLFPDGHTTWYPTSAVLSCQTTSKYQPVCEVYRGGTSGVPLQLIATTYQGAGDTVTLSGEPVRPGDALIMIWSQGNPGSVCTGQLFGEQEILT